MHCASPAPSRTSASAYGRDQADRVRSLIQRDGGLTVVGEGSEEHWVDLRQAETVLTMVVTLEDLAAISTDLADLITAGILKQQQRIPILLSLHDLETVCDL